MVDAFRWTNLFFVAILAGGMALELLILIPAARLLSAERLYAFYRFVAKRSGFFYALPSGVLALISALVVVFAGHDFDHASTILLLIGIVVLIGGALATGSRYMHELYVEMKNVSTFSESDIPQLLSRWRSAQLLRTTLYVGSLALFIAANVVY